MRIISWNLNYRNKNSRKNIIFALKQKPDIICLQEVREDTLDYLEKQEFHFYSELIAEGRMPSANTYQVVLSKQPFQNSGLIEFADDEPQTFLEKILRVYFRVKKYYRRATFVDLRDYRVINIQLGSYFKSSTRIRILQEIINHLHPEKKNIIAGDFNTLSESERIRFEGVSQKNNLELALTKGTTVSFLGISTLVDNFLITQSTIIKSTRIFPNRLGSDHKMIMVEI